MFDENDTLVLALAKELRAKGLFCATAESCTGGLIGAKLTAAPGSSEWYLGGVISYANRVKEQVLGVSPKDLATFGAVSEPVVRAMAEGVCRVTGADAAMATSGVAGPGGGSTEKPVGTVWIAVTLRGKTWAKKERFSGNRDAVRDQAAREALRMLLKLLRDEGVNL